MQEWDKNHDDTWLVIIAYQVLSTTDYASFSPATGTTYL